jgi:hypothetical protein
VPSVAPAARGALVVEAISGLQRRQRQMARMSQRDKTYKSKKRALRDDSGTAQDDFCQSELSAARFLRRIIHLAVPPRGTQVRAASFFCDFEQN